MKNIVYTFIIALFVIGCSTKETKKEVTPREKAIARIDSLEKKINESIKKAENPDVQLAMYAIQAYDYFVSELPNDSLVPGYIIKAAQLYDGVLQRPDLAVNKYEKFLTNYPQHQKAPMILFYQGNALSEMGDTTNAILKFQLFANQYPTHEFADDALGLIRFMRMDEKEMAKFLGKKSIKN